MLRPDGLKLRIDSFDTGSCLCLFAQCPRGYEGALIPGKCVIPHALGNRYHRRDQSQLFVICFGDARLEGDDDIGLLLRDGLKIKITFKNDRLGGQIRLRPGPGRKRKTVLRTPLLDD